MQVGGNPVGDLVDPTTHTLYVANNIDNTVSVINTATCNATYPSGCHETAPTIAVGNGPLALALDHANKTVYVTNVGGNTISMIDTATCNATRLSGCRHTASTVAVGNGPALLAVDAATNTIYIPNSNTDTVSVVDGATCNATDISGCADTATVPAGEGAAAVAVNDRTDTAYVANFNDGTVSVINTSACNAAVTYGCGQTPSTVTVGVQPDAVVIDQASNTAYIAFGPGGNASTNLGSVALINGATCNGAVTWGCGKTPRTTPVGSIPGWITENPVTRTVYAVNEEDSTVSVIDAATCNATDTAGCRRVPPALAIGSNGGADAVDPSTNTIYATSQNENDVSVLNGATCDATDTSGCTRFAPATTVGTGPQGIAADPATSTVYVGNRTDGNLSVIDAATCNAEHPESCGRPWPTVATGEGPQALAVNPLTDTVYTANAGVNLSGGNTVSVVDGSTCNARVTRGCGKAPATVTVGDNPMALAVNEATDTVYVANAGADLNGDTVSVVDGATCNGTNHSGCGLPVATITVGHAPASVAVDEATNTIYVVNGNDGTVSVINGATCNSTDQRGCGQTPPTFATASPSYVAVEQATHTVYVANYSATISVIDSNACNGQDQHGCTPIATMTAPDPITSMTVDQRTGAVFADLNVYGSNVWAFDGSRCNAQSMSGCTQTPDEVPVGGWPGDLANDPNTGTVYVPDNVDGEVSFFGYARGVAFP